MVEPIQRKIRAHLRIVCAHLRLVKRRRSETVPAQAPAPPKGNMNALKPVPSAAKGTDRLNLELPVDDRESINEAAADFEQKSLK